MFKMILKNLLIYILFLPLTGCLLLTFISSNNKKLLKLVALNFSCLTFICTLFLWVFFNKSTGIFQFVIKIFWLPNLNLNFILGVDGISLFFVVLTSLLIPLCFLISWNSIERNLKEYLISFLIMEFFLIGVFCILDLLLFYIFFESVLIPMFLIIGVWGSRERKIRAAYFFFIYITRFSFNVTFYHLYIFSNRYNRL